VELFPGSDSSLLSPHSVVYDALISGNDPGVGDREIICAPATSGQESTVNSNPRSPNEFLASLSSTDFERVRPHLHTIKLAQETVLVATGATLPHVYFPHSGIISLVVRLTEGQTIEVAMIGRDSVFGGSAALDGTVALSDAIVQLPGTASVLDIAQLRRAAEQSMTFRTTLIRHEQALLAQAQQSAACNAAHTVEARLSRWLLRARDLSGSDAVHVTQEFLSQMLGVQRTSVTIVANTFQQAGIIRYRRGNIQITDLDGLIDSACECYGTVKEHYAKLQRAP
jgi:CRP-like cAMP-binding protein